MDYQQFEDLIEKQISAYEKSEGRSINQYKKAKKQIDLYEIHLLDSMAANSKMQILEKFKERLNRAKQNKIVVKDELQVQQILQFGQDIDQRMNGILKDTQQAIKVSTYIRIELDKQIELLDNLEDENKEYKKRIKRVKKGLQVIIRRAMLNKVTRFLMVLVILAVIGLIIVYILKQNGTIKV